MLASAIMQGAGALASVGGLISAFKGAKQLKNLANQVPEYQRSQYANQMMGTAQANLNFNPFQAAQSRGVSSRIANQVSAAKGIGSGSTLLGLVGAYNAAGADESYKNSMMDYQMRGQRMQDLYNAQAQNLGEDRNVYENQMTRFNSRANLINAANQTITKGFDSLAANLSGGAKLMGNTNIDFGKIFGKKGG